jgi:hypothetical protein
MNSFFNSFPKIFKGLRWDGLQGSSWALAGAHLTNELKSPLIFICAKDEAAEIFSKDLRFFLQLTSQNDQKVSYLPERKTDLDPNRVESESVGWKRLSIFHDG